MIQNSKQVWLPGFMVKVGFMNLKVIERIETPDDSMPDAYILESNKGQRYRFVPHNGLERL